MQKTLKIKAFQDIRFILSRCRSVSAAGFFRFRGVLLYCLYGRVYFVGEGLLCTHKANPLEVAIIDKQHMN